MKRVKLSNEEIDLIIESLGIAEEKFADLQKQMFDVSRCRNNPYKSDRIEQGMQFYEVCCKLQELNVKLKNISQDGAE